MYIFWCVNLLDISLQKLKYQGIQVNDNVKHLLSFLANILGSHLG